MDRWRGRVAFLALATLAGLAGCQLGNGLMLDLTPGHGRADREFAATLGNSVRAALAALDDLQVKPEEGAIRAMDAVSDIGKRKWADQSNAEYLPDDESFHDLFDKHLLNVAGREPNPFNPVLVTYKGAAADGRPVHVIIRAQPPDASRTLVLVRLGRRDGDEGWGKDFLDRVAGHLESKGQLRPTPPPAPDPASAPASPAADASLPPLPR